jgi:hypothetical protein
MKSKSILTSISLLIIGILLGWLLSSNCSGKGIVKEDTIRIDTVKFIVKDTIIELDTIEITRKIPYPVIEERIVYVDSSKFRVPENVVERDQFMHYDELYDNGNFRIVGDIRYRGDIFIS